MEAVESAPPHSVLLQSSISFYFKDLAGGFVFFFSALRQFVSLFLYDIMISSLSAID